MLLAVQPASVEDAPWVKLCAMGRCVMVTHTSAGALHPDPLPALRPETAEKLCTWPVPAQDSGQQALRDQPTAVPMET